MDKNDKSFLPNKWKYIYKIDLTHNLPERIPKFDVIIDYGVIGWPGVNTHLNQEQITKYIRNVSFLLEKNGLYFLIDYKYITEIHNYIIQINCLDVISDYFISSDFMIYQKSIQNERITTLLF